MKKYLFDIGDIVQIKQGTEYYRNSSAHNPKETNGVVSDFEEDVFFYRVKWANGQNNVYRESDLVNNLISYIFVVTKISKKWL